MATESSLSRSIDKLAQRKAESYLGNIYASIAKALKASYQPIPNHTYYAKKDIIQVLEETVAYLKYDKSTSLNPSPELVEAFRSAVLDKLLSELPTITELARLHEEGTEE